MPRLPVAVLLCLCQLGLSERVGEMIDPMGLGGPVTAACFSLLRDRPFQSVERVPHQLGVPQTNIPQWHTLAWTEDWVHEGIGQLNMQ